MVTHLLESEGRRRSLGSAVPSIALHGALIVLAVHATAHAALRKLADKPVVDTIVFRAAQQATARELAEHPQVSRVSPAVTKEPVQVPISPSPRLSFSLEAISNPPTPIVSRGDFAAGLTTESRVATIHGVDSVPLDAHAVDRQAEPLPGTVPPAYPNALRAAGVRGDVVAQFVVDTAGRVEVKSIQLLTSANPLFSAAVRDALIGARFRPAEYAGSPVRQLVQQRFSFVLQ